LKDLFLKKEKIKNQKIMSIYTKLLKIQKEVKGLSKDKKSYSFSYVTGNKLLSFIKPLMDDNGLLLKQEVLSIDNERMDYATKNGQKSEILSKVMMKFTWVDTETGETDVNMFGANGQNDWEKGLGSALTYAERYFLLKYFHIATDEDDIDNPDRVSKNEAVKTIAKTKPTLTEETNGEPTKAWLNIEVKVAEGVITNMAQIEKAYKITPEIKTKLELLLKAK
jgi:hypothetical protein